MSDRRENSLLFSLNELKGLEEERLADEAAAVRAREEAERRAKEDAERRIREAEEAKIRAKEEAERLQSREEILKEVEQLKRKLNDIR